jgi:aminoglycoside 6'-N-acetyltransferase I
VILMLRSLDLRADRAEFWRMRRLLHTTLVDGEEEQEMAGVAKLIAGENYAVFVHDRGGGQLGGFVEVGERDYAEGCTTRPVAYIEAWFVDGNLRRKGLGAQLVATAIAWARGRGLTEVGSDTLLDNEISIRAHRALGFARIETQVCFLKKL